MFININHELVYESGYQKNEAPVQLNYDSLRFLFDVFFQRKARHARCQMGLVSRRALGCIIAILSGQLCVIRVENRRQRIRKVFKNIVAAAM